eukprot:TRINITY_DN3719_c0_g1_i1.p1 TRINITY_DN3719_c0_g1~~TRINITY_DN3719_c0_g1_i1.p1  ORF type:complete len:590 (-),score=105.24 TRINITY_DN3719_c0_g1_i1:61-1593(-)
MIKYSSTKTASLFDYFGEVHNKNTGYWHYNSFFLPVHRFFLWKFESALQYIARTEGPTMVPPVLNPCMTVPYWPWDLEANIDNTMPQNKSVIFTGEYIGKCPDSKATDYTVTSGAFANWKVYDEYNARCGEASCRTSTDSKYGPKDNNLKRYFDPKSPFRYDMSAVLTHCASNTYYNFTKVFEGWHSTAHTWLAYCMSSQRSPYEPLFFMHHAQIDRVFGIWQDCWDFDAVDPSVLTDNHPVFYKNSTWASSPPASFAFSIDDRVPFTLSSSDLGPFSNLNPTAREIYHMGTATKPAYEGMYFRYGADKMVTDLSVVGSPVCPKNLNGWTLVNQLSKKRQVDTDAVLNKMLEASDQAINLEKLEKRLNDAKEKAAQSKKYGLEGLQFISKLMCSAIPKLEVSDNLLAFIEGNGGDASTLNNLATSCDKVSMVSYCTKNPRHKWCGVPSFTFGENEKQTIQESNMKTFYVTTLSVVGVVGAISLVVVVVMGVTFYKKSISQQDQNSYHLQM